MSEPVTVARPYAKAAFEIACEDRAVPHWAEVLSELEALLKKNVVLRAVQDPTCTPQQISQSVIYRLDDLLKEKTKNFIRLLAKKKRLILASYIKTLFEAYRADQEQRVQAEVVSAMALDQNQQDVICRMLENYLSAQVIVHCRIDKALLGGAVIRAGDLTIDGSLKHRLEKLSDALGV